MATPKYGIELVTAPATEPLEVADITAHSRINANDIDQGVIAGFISSAREYVEQVTGRQIISAQYRMSLDMFPGRFLDDFRPPGWRYGTLRMPKPPLVSIDEVKYIDTNGDLQTLATTEYQWSKRAEPGRLAPARFKIWPQTDPQSFDAVQVLFTCGWANAAAVPPRVKQAIRLLVAHLYENREATVEASLNEIPYGLQRFIGSCGYGEIV